MKIKLLIVAVLSLCLLLGGCEQTRRTPPASPNQPEASQPADTGEGQGEPTGEEPAEEEPTEEELKELFTRAMHEINELATEETRSTIQEIFNSEIEFDLNDELRVDSYSYSHVYIRTSRQYSELKDYYGQIFTDEALDWLMSKRFFNLDGTLYCSRYGGASGRGFKFLSLEKLQENTYKGTYLTFHTVPEGEEESTVFEVKKTDAGYRISSIDYCPPFLNWSMK